MTTPKWTFVRAPPGLASAGAVVDADGHTMIAEIAPDAAEYGLLLAAAPDLAEALRIVLVQFGEYKDGDGAAKFHAINIARAALAKAEPRRYFVDVGAGPFSRRELAPIALARGEVFFIGHEPPGRREVNCEVCGAELTARGDLATAVFADHDHDGQHTARAVHCRNCERNYEIIEEAP